MVNGVRLLAFLTIPMLGDKHPSEYPRFRDVFAADSEHPEWDGYIHVYTRVGGNNRECGYGEDELYDHSNYVATFDDNYDCTYATYVFSVPGEWRDDWNAVMEGRFEDTSDKYRAQVEKVCPKMIGKLPWSEDS